MAIKKINNPSVVPSSIVDYQQQNELIEHLLRRTEDNIICEYVGSNNYYSAYTMGIKIKKGSTIIFNDILYYVDNDITITYTTSHSLLFKKHFYYALIFSPSGFSIQPRHSLVADNYEKFHYYVEMDGYYNHDKTKKYTGVHIIIPPYENARTINGAELTPYITKMQQGIPGMIYERSVFMPEPRFLFFGKWKKTNIQKDKNLYKRKVKNNNSGQEEFDNFAKNSNIIEHGIPRLYGRSNGVVTYKDVENFNGTFLKFWKRNFNNFYLPQQSSEVGFSDIVIDSSTVIPVSDYVTPRSLPYQEWICYSLENLIL